MKHLIIRSIGPIKEADIQFKKLNVIIGPQSMGKSTVLKLASYCTWVEKRIELTQRPDVFMADGLFKKELETFHKMRGYFHEDSYLLYESDFMTFSYDFSKELFSFVWQEGRWDYRRTKISYIPAERNLVAAIPNWFEVTLERNNIRNFMSEWEIARKANDKQIPILNLNVDYKYESEKKTDKVRIQNGEMMEMTNVSSGLQSLIPLYVHLNYLYHGSFDSEEAQKIEGDWYNEDLSKTIYEELFEKKGRTKVKHKMTLEVGNGKKQEFPLLFPLRNGPHRFLFSESHDADEFDKYLKRFKITNHCDVFLEEPENNLFPPTQMRLARWLYDMTLGRKSNSLFVATHSPYVLSAFLEKDSDIGLFYALDETNGAVVKTATREDCQSIYDNGVDAFFNIENLGE